MNSISKLLCLLFFIILIIIIFNDNKVKKELKIYYLNNPTNNAIQLYLKKQQPFIIKNIKNEFDYITPEYLSHNFGDILIRAYSTIAEHDKTVLEEIKLKTFFDEYDKKVLYIKEDFDFLHKTKLKDDIQKKLSKYLTNKFLRTYATWIGSKNSKTGIHKDPDEQNFLVQVYGTKKVFIFESLNDDYIYPSKKFDAGATLSSINYWDINYKKYPLFKKVKQYEVILQSGDILYMPPNIWHAAMNISNSIAISGRSESLYSTITKIPILIKLILHGYGYFSDCVCHNKNYKIKNI